MSTDSAVLTPEETAESIGIPIDELEEYSSQLGLAKP